MKFVLFYCICISSVLNFSFNKKINDNKGINLNQQTNNQQVNLNSNQNLNLVQKVNNNKITPVQSIDNNFSKEVSNDQTSIEEIVDHQWNKLFQDFSQRKCAEKYKYQYMGYDFNNKTYVLPKANLNMEKKYSKIGQGQVAYLFDYLDDVFQKPIANYFLKLWNDAKSVIEDAHYKDPYDIDLILNEAEKLLMTPKARELNYTVKASSMSPQEITARMKMISHKFDYEIWNNSLSAKKISTIIRQWGYFRKYETNDEPKFIIDKYDLDGDGRLNAKEFILFTINNNKNIISTGSCIKCYYTMTSKSIDPIFDFLDCTGDDLISTEKICEGFSFLRRNNPTFYNMFECKLGDSLYRTSACNDLILKNFKKKQGYLTKSEFRTGILLGYWDRQTHRRGVYSGDEKNLKNTRWSRGGLVDIFCESLHKFN
jgi:Ca2+-binding EF-hand superfamily protein